MVLFCKCNKNTIEKKKPTHSDEFITAKYLLEHIDFKELEVIYDRSIQLWITLKYKDLKLTFKTPMFFFSLNDFEKNQISERDEILGIIKNLEEKHRQSILDKLIDEKIEADKKPTKKRK